MTRSEMRGAKSGRITGFPASSGYSHAFPARLAGMFPFLPHIRQARSYRITDQVGIARPEVISMGDVELPCMRVAVNPAIGCVQRS